MRKRKEYVWVVLGSYDYEGATLYGVYKTEKRAKANESKAKGDWVRVEKWLVE